MDMPKSPQTSWSRPVEKVIVHPLVLLSIVDHYNQIAKKTLERVVGVLLGTSFQGIVDVSNSYAVPFEEAMNPGIWFLDHNYHEAMLSMFKKIKGVEHVLRDVKDTIIISTLAIEVSNKLTALRGFNARLKEINWHLNAGFFRWYPLNQETLYHLKDMFSRCPNLDLSDELKKAFAVKRNDMMLVIYLCSLIRCVIALHNLINNKILYKEHEKAEDAKPVEVPVDYDGVP